MFPPTRRSRLGDAARDALLVMGGAALGAALMYFLQPTLSRRAAASEPVDDTVLTERVRGALSRVVKDPNAIDVRVRDGCVILRGPVLSEEAAEIVACAERVPGVRAVENRLAVNPVP
jgi:osmotically-inducible protein OsmY